LFFARGTGNFGFNFLRGDKVQKRIWPFLMAVLLMLGTFETGVVWQPSTAQGKAAELPNIIFILADDLGYGDLGCYGQKLIQTPQLDRMASEGMRFLQFYAGSTVCAPSRSVLMTGQHVGHTTVRGNGRAEAQRLKAGDVTVAEVLKAAGYRTGLIGKWGLGLPGDEGIPTRQGFDSFFGFLSQVHAHNHYPDYLWRHEEKVPIPNQVVAVGPEGAGYATQRIQYAGDLFAAESLKFVEENRDRPFFLYLAVTVPHANNERFHALKDGQEVPDYGPYASRDWPAPLKGQAAMITRLDSQVGQLLAHLKELGLDRKTLVLFSSDNGPHREGGNRPEFFEASGPVRGTKRDLTDGGIRVPLLARWPGKIKAGVVSPQVGYFGDMMATFGELAGVQLPAGLDSVSLIPTLLDRGTQKQHEYLYWEFHEAPGLPGGKGFSQAVLLEGRWKGIRMYRRSAPMVLYDLSNDVAEQKDLAGSRPDLVARISWIMQRARSDSSQWPIIDAPEPAASSQ
jgi:arylsulfatase A-like enzyme